jgi:hypothetical protein
LGSLAENAEQRSPAETAAPAAAFVEEALAAIGEGGFNEAFARIGALLARPGKMPLSRVALRKEIAVDYAGLLPQITAEAWRRMRGEQEIIVRHAPEQALAMLPRLVADEAERARLLRLVDRLVADPRMQANAPTADQADMLARIRAALAPAQAAPRLAAVKN